ncbi:MAG: FHIPEP family type III secretion protein [Polyangiaceae bacterium]|nr:FHIPEP family type III secretion protein [Polyangiaceae bacterium]MCW5791244.1 FHIPEP family type III secretion protein [Polyangiaceae bacterium]
MPANALLRAPKRRGLGVADLALAAMVIAVVGLMIVPLPTWLLDLLIAGNIAISVVLLLITLYITDALKIAVFPTLLLLTTLVRVALNVSSARLILLQADAGEVIEAFGRFVVRGNYVVGGVVFLVLTLIQFLVIAKGAERVAEVGARFTLDAMPGKQMAIDAELRSGAIDSAEARRRRRELGRESQFYGAMDGAMKFVKGDTIAAFLITLVNILGGLAIGVGQRDMEVSYALKKYGLLTIGDGLVSQIPALMIAVAAGVLVTRVASEESGTPLGQELSSQLFSTPKALRVSAGFVLLLALVPGLPAVPFLVIGVLLWFGSRARTRQLKHEEEQVAAEPIQKRTGGGGGPRFVPVVIPWSLEVSPDLAPLVDDEVRGEEVKRAGLRAAAAAVRELMFRDLGLPLPPAKVTVSDAPLERQVVLHIHELPAASIQIPDTLGDTEIASFVVDEVILALRPRAADFLGIAETQMLLDQLEQVAPATVRQVVPKPVSVPLLTDILRRLIEEGINVRDLKGILESLSQVAAADKDPLNLAEFVRSQLRRAITHELTEGAPELGVYLLDPSIEDVVRSAIQRTAAGSFLALSPAAGRDIVAAVRRQLELTGYPEQPVLLTQPDVRRFVRKLLDTELPGARVVSYAELLPEVRLSTIARIGIGR